MTNFTSINLGGAPNDHTGDALRVGGQKINTNFSLIDTGPITIGPPVSSIINLTIDQGTSQNDQTPGLEIKGSSGFNVGMSLCANATTPGVASFDFQQTSNGNAFINVRAAAALTVSTNNTSRMTVASTGQITINAPALNDVQALVINGTSLVGGGNPSLRVNASSAQEIVAFNSSNANGGYVAILRNNAAKSFYGNASQLATGGAGLDDIVLRSEAALYFSTGGSSSRINIASNGTVTVITPSSGQSLIVNQGALYNPTTPGIQIAGNSGNGAFLSITGNGTSPGNNSFDFYQGSAGDATINQRANSTLTFATNNTVAISVGAGQKVQFIKSIGVNNTPPPLQVTGWGTATNAGVINNFTGSAATLAQTGQVVAQIINDLKAIGFYGA